MTPGNNLYTLNNQHGLFPSEIAEKPFSDEREQYFTPPPLHKRNFKKSGHSERLPIKETPGEKPLFDSIQPSDFRYQQLHSNR